MTALAQTALDFCRECLGWEDAYEDDSGLYIYIRPGSVNKLLYGDLNGVMSMVQLWLERNNLRGYLGVTRHGYSFAVHDSIASAQISDEGRLASKCSAKPCQALLAACVDASRKLRAG